MTFLPSALRKAILYFLTALISGIAFFVYFHLPAIEAPHTDSRVINDASSLNPTLIDKIVSIRNEGDISQALTYAREHKLKISIAGKRHSMGGQAFYKGAVVLDMTTYNAVESLDPKAKILVVQSGGTWNEIQKYLNPLGYAVIAMQGPNIFTVGGSISVNAHGWDKTSPTVAETVEWFRLMLADGTIKHCSMKENSELYHLVLGGYGLFGVILDVGLKVTENVTLKPRYTHITYRDFPQHYETVTKPNEKIDLTYGDLSIAADSFLDELVVSDFERVGRNVDLSQVALDDEQNILRDRFFLNLSRKYDWGKSLRWYLYKQYQLPEDSITRNNLMRSAYERLLYYSPEDVDILQEYFIPRGRAVEFIERIRLIIRKHNANLLNCTVRVINQSGAPFLNYAKRDAFAFVLYFNVKKDKVGLQKDEALTRDLIDEALHFGGTFYLPYLPYYDQKQLSAAYPEINQFFTLKRKYDPEEKFTNYFYEKYGRITTKP